MAENRTESRQDRVNVQKIKSLMALKDDKQDDLAAILGQTRSTVNRKVTGKKNFLITDLVIIADHYGVKLKDLFSD